MTKNYNQKIFIKKHKILHYKLNSYVSQNQNLLNIFADKYKKLQLIQNNVVRPFSNFSLEVALSIDIMNWQKVEANTVFENINLHILVKNHLKTFYN